ncbi:lipid A deacylase LpxR family protein [Paeniroseomonas aquatica]|uniref:Lipid A deacylase LpxR family protein n=1 Tax=Paeniroseomonas aquatica TaxID=373043 RepID=A0ABT8A4A2_9PROT|nr:lipid A deacylase LpxR family protein [Paeniroseomonas aquatica]MDN3564373.1 lipid A deacylase LpxR family protein [Paeniroseomonas aquatica]
MMRSAAIALSATLALGGTAAAQTGPARDLPAPDRRAAISFLSENDTYGRSTDRYYTNGARFNWSSAEESLPGPMAALDRALADLFGPARSRWGIALGQNMYTPINKRLREPDPRDRPYAGLLYGEVSLDRRTSTTLDRFSMTLGVVGPTSLARQTQDIVHAAIGDRQARGWGFQIHDEPVFNIGYERTWRERLLNLPGDLAVDALPTVTLAAGTIHTYAGVGARVRIGQGLERDFGAPRIRPTIADSPAPVGDGFGWYLFAGAGGRAIARDITLDGNTFRDSRSVDPRHFVSDLELGGAVFWQNIRLAYTQDFRSKEYVGQKKDFVFGALSLSFSF